MDKYIKVSDLLELISDSETRTRIKRTVESLPMVTPFEIFSVQRLNQFELEQLTDPHFHELVERNLYSKLADVFIQQARDNGYIKIDRKNNYSADEVEIRARVIVSLFYPPTEVKQPLPKMFSGFNYVGEETPK